jgi:hypothetical protein
LDERGFAAAFYAADSNLAVNNERKSLPAGGHILTKPPESDAAGVFFFFGLI